MPMELGYSALPSTWVSSSTQKQSQLHCLGSFMEVSSLRHDRFLTQSPALLSPPCNLESGAESFRLLIKVWSF